MLPLIIFSTLIAIFYTVYINYPEQEEIETSFKPIPILERMDYLVNYSNSVLKVNNEAVLAVSMNFRQIRNVITNEFDELLFKYSENKETYEESKKKNDVKMQSLITDTIQKLSFEAMKKYNASTVYTNNNDIVIIFKPTAQNHIYGGDANKIVSNISNFISTRFIILLSSNYVKLSKSTEESKIKLNADILILFNNATKNFKLEINKIVLEDRFTYEIINFIKSRMIHNKKNFINDALESTRLDYLLKFENVEFLLEETDAEDDTYERKTIVRRKLEDITCDEETLNMILNNRWNKESELDNNLEIEPLDDTGFIFLTNDTNTESKTQELIF